MNYIYFFWTLGLKKRKKGGAIFLLLAYPTNMEAIDAFNAVHAGLRVKVEWGIGGMKRKWRKLMKKFDSTLQEFPHFFRACAILTNFLQRRRLDMRAYLEAGDLGDPSWDD